ncbi:MAG: D-lyxose/D-mannose family sugar isomerase [Oscillospiraceae bacterium]|nr:D-lyxose/D-mannose family sugar isomerase [Oscillospiraceae bacterium]
MLTKVVYEEARRRALEFLYRAGIAVSDAEKENIEVAEYGKGDLDSIGLELVVYVNTDRCCAKELVLFPGQTCPEHRHPAVGGEPGKEETFRCRWGEAYLFVPGERSENPQGKPPAGYEKHFSCEHEIVLRPGDQYTLEPDTLHWFRAGPDGAVISEFSTKSRDELDIYTDPQIVASQARTL